MQEEGIILNEEIQEQAFIEKVVFINRVTKVTKGGKNLKFSALVVVGDGKGRVGYGLGKAPEVVDAIRKGINLGKKNLITVPLKGDTIPHEVIGEFGAVKVLLKPASKGTGVIAAGAVRAVVEVAGITNVLTKSLGSNNALNIAAATVKALEQLKDPREEAVLRGVDIEKVTPFWSRG